MIEGYYYLHENGDLIYKREIDGDTLADLRDSPFVVGIWPMDPTDRMTAWNFCVESLASGGSRDRIHQFAAKWHCNDEDATNYADRIGCLLGEDGNQKTAARRDFTDLHESPCGFGNTYLDAMADLAWQLGYEPRKLWGVTFMEMMKCESQ